MSETKSEAHTSAQHLFLHDPEGREPSLDFVEYWRTLRKYKDPPDQQDAAVELVLRQAKALGEAWA